MTINRRTFLGAVVPVTAAAGLVAGTGGAARAVGREEAVATLRTMADDSYDGSDLWLRYVPVSDPGLLRRYRESVTTDHRGERRPEQGVPPHAGPEHGAGIGREAGGDHSGGGQGRNWSEASAGCWAGRCR